MRRAPALAGRHRAHDGGGDYFASMTDLMLGLVFIFIIMLMVLALDMRQAEQRMTEATKALTETDLARRDLLRDLSRILAAKLPVTIDEENGTLSLGGDILFPKGSADPYPEALPKLLLLGAALDQILPCYAVAAAAPPQSACGATHQGRLDAVYIEGHTDASPIRTPRFQSNWDLSAARASETFNHLTAAFPELAALKNDHAAALIGVSGYGENRPVDAAGDEAAMQRNRRIELRFIMASPDAPRVDGLRNAVDKARAR